MKNSYLTVTDQFCGAGGSSQGIRNLSRKLGGGVEVKLALNHWALAIETHNTNFPDTLHDCTDISACDPRRYPKTNMLITSPECTNHSLAKGRKRKVHGDLFAALNPAEERSRATMWDVPRFAEYHNYELIIVENVVDARYWVMWEAWLKAMHLLGYDHKCVYLNSMHCHPTPQSRDRMYIVFWKKGNKAPDLEIRPVGYCVKCAKDTETYWNKPQIITTRYSSGIKCRVRAADEDVLPTQPGDQSHAILNPLIINSLNSQTRKNLNNVVRGSLDKALSTQTTIAGLHLLTPLITNGEYSNGRNKIRNSIEETAYTQTTRATNGVVMPFIVENKGQSKARSIEAPMGCITTKDYHALLSDESMRSFIAHYYGGSNVASDIKEPARTFSTKDRSALITPGTKPKLEDCYYRMLLPHEVKIGMAFDSDYVVLGSGKDQVKQLGNAVTPPAMEDLSARCIQTLM